MRLSLRFATCGFVAISVSFCLSRIVYELENLEGMKSNVEVKSIHTRKEIRIKNADDFLSQRFEYRKKKMQEYCQKRGKVQNSLDFLSDKRVLYAFLIDTKRKVLLCGVPKSGSTSWQKVFTAMTNPSEYKNMLQLDLGRKIYTIAPHLDEVSKGNMTLLHNYLLDNKEYMRIASVRHPLARLYSAWKQKFHSNFVAFPYFWRKYGQAIVTRFQNGENATEDLNFPARFESFIRYVAEEGNHFSDWHWKSSTDYFCHPCEVKYDYVTYADTLSVEANYILHEKISNKNTNLKVDDWIRFPSRYKSSFSTESILKNAYKNVPADVMKDILKLYRSDFNAFGFPTLDIPII